MILPSLANTGPGIVVHDLCTGLVRRGYTCEVFYFDDDVELKMPCPIKHISFWRSIDFSNWDVIHSHMLRPDLYVRIHSFRLKNKPKLISTLHNPISYQAFRTGFGPIQSIIGTVLWKFALTAFNNVVVLNGDTYSNISGVNRRKLSVIFNGREIFPTEYSNPLDKDAIAIADIKKEYCVIGTISSITKRKGLEQIVKALSELPGFAFVAVGDGPELIKLKKMAEQKNVSNRCYWTGYKQNAVEYLSLFDIFLMCSKSEGFPLALIEAAAYSKPTVLSNIPILQSIITSDEVVFYDLGNLGSLVSAILKIRENMPYYAEKIHSYYENHLTADVMTENYERLYKCQNLC